MVRQGPSTFQFRLRKASLTRRPSTGGRRLVVGRRRLRLGEAAFAANGTVAEVVRRRACYIVQIGRLHDAAAVVDVSGVLLVAVEVVTVSDRNAITRCGAVEWGVVELVEGGHVVVGGTSHQDGGRRRRAAALVGLGDGAGVVRWFCDVDTGKKIGGFGEHDALSAKEKIRHSLDGDPNLQHLPFLSFDVLLFMPGKRGRTDRPTENNEENKAAPLNFVPW